MFTAYSFNQRAAPFLFEATVIATEASRAKTRTSLSFGRPPKLRPVLRGSGQMALVVLQNGWDACRLDRFQCLPHLALLRKARVTTLHRPLCQCCSTTTLCVPEESVTVKTDEIVYPKRLQSRDDGGQKIIHLKDGLILHLEKMSALADIVTVAELNGGVPVQSAINGKDIEKNLYGDNTTMASVLLKEDMGGIILEGILSDTARIKPLPASPRSKDGQTPHLIYYISEPREEMWPDPLSFYDQNQEARMPAFSERQIGGELKDFIVEVYVLSDQLHSAKFPHGEYLVAYLATLLNAVNLRYQSLRDPTIKMRLVGVTQTKSRDEYFIVRRPGAQYIDAAKTIEELTFYVRSRLHSDIDLVMLLTGGDMIGVDPTTRRDTPNLLGLAYIGGLCTIYKVGAMEDDGETYSGVQTFAHEAAHILGAQHDGQGPPDHMPFSPGARACSWNEGYLMSYRRVDLNQYKFSSCSVKQFRYVIGLRSAKCWATHYEHIDYNRKFPFLPGVVLRGNTFCQLLRPEAKDVYYKDTPDDIAQCRLFCCSPKMGTCVQSAALDGMYCGPNKICISGECQNKA